MYQSFDLKQLRRENPNYIPKAPFEHQKDAFANLSKLCSFDNKSYKSGLLVLPTGAGKTFTSVNRICRNVVPKNKKVLWLAHTSYQISIENMLGVPK